MIKVPRITKICTKTPNKIHVIRQKEILKQNWWSLGPHQDRYYSSYLDGKHYIYSFTTFECATKCLQFLQEYQLKYNKYPDLDKPVLNKEKSKEIYVEPDTIGSLKNRCLMNGIGLFLINDCDYSRFNLEISGVDVLENVSLDKTDHLEHLNYLMEM
jgi:hypothetical protein